MMDQTDLFWEREIDRLRLLPRYTLSHAEIRIAPSRVANPLGRAQLINIDIFPLMKSADSLHSLRALVNVLDWQSANI